MKNSFKWIAYAEGISLLTLFFVAMPIKYILGHKEAVQVVGSLHGLLFIVYVVFATARYQQEKWPMKKLVLAYVASALPFGTFWFEKKIDHTL